MPIRLQENTLYSGRITMQKDVDLGEFIGGERKSTTSTTM